MDAYISVFYDFNEQAEILGRDIAEYLRPIYQSDAQFVIPLLTAAYPERVWAKFESEHFRQRFGSGNVIPVVFGDAPPGIFDRSRDVGGLFLTGQSPQTSRLQHSSKCYVSE